MTAQSGCGGECKRGRASSAQGIRYSAIIRHNQGTSIIAQLTPCEDSVIPSPRTPPPPQRPTPDTPPTTYLRRLAMPKARLAKVAPNPGLQVPPRAPIIASTQTIALPPQGCRPRGSRCESSAEFWSPPPSRTDNSTNTDQAPTPSWLPSQTPALRRVHRILVSKSPLVHRQQHQHRPLLYPLRVADPEARLAKVAPNPSLQIPPRAPTTA